LSITSLIISSSPFSAQIFKNRIGISSHAIDKKREALEQVFGPHSPLVRAEEEIFLATSLLQHV
jgi:hypothetical protein